MLSKDFCLNFTYFVQTTVDQKNVPQGSTYHLSMEKLIETFFSFISSFRLQRTCFPGLLLVSVSTFSGEMVTVTMKSKCAIEGLKMPAVKST